MYLIDAYLTSDARLFHLKTKRSGLPLTAFVKGRDGGDVSIPGGSASGWGSFGNSLIETNVSILYIVVNACIATPVTIIVDTNIP